MFGTIPRKFDWQPLLDIGSLFDKKIKLVTDQNKKLNDQVRFLAAQKVNFRCGECGNKGTTSYGLEILDECDALKETVLGLASVLEKLTRRMNPATAAFRHGQAATEEDITKLCNAQIEAECELTLYEATIARLRGEGL